MAQRPVFEPCSDPEIFISTFHLKLYQFDPLFLTVGSLRLGHHGDGQNKVK